MPRKYVCPACRQKTGVNIVFGYPTPELADRAERGEVALGGCVLSEEAPDRHCTSCEHEWRIVRRKPWPEDDLAFRPDRAP